jgi:N-methylhydantoinase A/oxoprolinase/acetone carboxylase beta subunit|tara:strand:- start:113 stop:2116 length:2004 start_codon:yes stop_codon:yes gene_type:complete
MTILLGVDTGGTYTDAVLVRNETDVIASAKSLTTRSDLAVGIGKAIKEVLGQAQVGPQDISLASLSTTLATNALVEGQGGRVGLIYIGFDARDLDTQGLKAALNGDPVICLAGGHDYSGVESRPLDEAALHSWLSIGHGVSAFAVASQFATRNPIHEQRVVKVIGEVTGKPVSASHHLSSKLNGPKRALTALLNARLIGLTYKLIGRAESVLKNIGIGAPLMVVRGDGALIPSEMAKERPIETILSGPAASIVGARWLTGLDHALVSDIGGTTTDIALLRNGKPEIDAAGAQVGPYRTMVEAVAMRTTGLGGDSEVGFISDGLLGGVKLGPKRVIPISLLAHEAPDVVLPALKKQLQASTPGEYDCLFVRKVDGIDTAGLSLRDQTVFERISNKIYPLGQVLETRVEALSIQRLVSRGLVEVSGVTPSDACHVLDLLDTWDREAANIALEIFGRRRTGAGNTLAQTGYDMAHIIINQLTAQTSQALLEAAFKEEIEPYLGLPEDLANNELVQRGLARSDGLVKIETSLNIDVIGLGASATTYYPAVGNKLHCIVNLPQHAGVANAIGAVVGRVTMRQSGTITAPSEGIFRVHFVDGPEDFSVEDEALTALEERLGKIATAEAKAGGTENVQLVARRDIKRANAESRDIFIEATVSVEASGRPRTSLS